MRDFGGLGPAAAAADKVRLRSGKSHYPPAVQIGADLPLRFSREEWARFAPGYDYLRSAPSFLQGERPVTMPYFQSFNAAPAAAAASERLK